MNASNEQTESGPRPDRIVLVLAFASGLTALIYELLWMRELRLLLGSASEAAATTLVAFFAGTALGSWWWGRHPGDSRRALRTYATLEAGMAGSALLYFLLLRIYHLIYGPLFGAFGDNPALFTTVKFLLSVGVLLPPCFFMGGTLPVLGEFLVSHPHELGRKATLLYAVNTAGAALGAILAGFFLPRWFGFLVSYCLTIALNIAIAAAAWILSSSARTAAPSAQPPSPSPYPAPTAAIVPTETQPAVRLSIPVVAFLSGFCALALEVLWTRMFEQILPNSVYTFAVILFVFLISLALGSAAANWLSRFAADSRFILCLMLLLAGVAVSLTPQVFWHSSHGLQYMTATRGWPAHMLLILGRAAAVLVPPVVLLGMIFPYLFKTSEAPGARAGRTLGNLGAINTVGAVLGSLAAGYLFFHRLGLWGGITWVATLYLAMAALLPGGKARAIWPARGLAVVYAAVLLLGFNPSALPVVALSAARQETLWKKWEGNAGTVAVIRTPNNLMVKVNNAYIIGDVEGRAFERRQSEIPMLLHAEAKSVFLLGLGTGITAGAVLCFPVDRVTACELIPEVVAASRQYFRQYVNNLYDDRRVRIVIEDGRNFLKGTPEKYDVIISDLFVPFNAGAGALYSLEHFQASRQRLEKDGLFVQWLPAYMLSPREFLIVAKTMLDVFPHVTVWRGNFLSDHPILALVGHPDATPLDPGKLLRRTKELLAGSTPADDAAMAQILRFYAGNLTSLKAALEDLPVNTDDDPVIEYLAPITNSGHESGKAQPLTSFTLAQLFDELLASVPPEKDPYLSRLSPKEFGYVRAGLSFYKAYACARAGRTAETRKFYQEFLAHYPPGLAPSIGE